jgi:hypothetical protein
MRHVANDVAAQHSIAHRFRLAELIGAIVEDGSFRRRDGLITVSASGVGELSGRYSR